MGSARGVGGMQEGKITQEEGLRPAKCHGIKELSGRFGGHFLSTTAKMSTGRGSDYAISPVAFGDNHNSEIKMFTRGEGSKE